jgi:hypothetical protein
LNVAAALQRRFEAARDVGDGLARLRDESSAPYRAKEQLRGRPELLQLDRRCQMI